MVKDENLPNCNFWVGYQKPSKCRLLCTNEYGFFVLTTNMKLMVKSMYLMHFIPTFRLFECDVAIALGFACLIRPQLHC